MAPLYFQLSPMQKTPNNHHNANDHEGNAQPLPHVKGHVALKVDLDVFQKLNGNTRAKDDDEEGAEHQAWLLVAEVTLVVHPQQDAHGNEAEKRLIETRRVARQPLRRWTTLTRGAGRVVVDGAAELFLSAQEDETPWQRGGRTVDLMVHHIAAANQGAHETDGHHDAVKNPDIVDALQVGLFFLCRLVVAPHIEP